MNRQRLGSDKNNDDKLGHFAQGFVPAIIAREIFLCQHVIKTRRWVSFLTLCCCLGFSACYELTD